ncbi:putative RNA/DNA demethylase ALKBH6 isoform X1 [Clavelina lepadiformis]|uniref:putative RNA/DNA demethylase ALKBH6 isoform X1 n=1 Tax=Clavelina lepadiformis TaxID=159417 RepID=UPI004041DD76
MPANLEHHRITEVPDSAYYIPDFITESKEKSLLDKIYTAPIPKWTCLSNRRLQNWGGLPHPKGMVQEKVPDWLQFEDILSEYGLFGSHAPNHILVNEYKPGQGIMPHKDGPLYFPTVATVSLGCQTVLNFYKNNMDIDQNTCNEFMFSFLLERRSLLVLREDMYINYLHGISDVEVDNISRESIKNSSLLGSKSLAQKVTKNDCFALPRDDTRVSITIRYVPKIIKFKFRT